MKIETIKTVLDIYDKFKDAGFGAFYTMSPLAIRLYLSPYKVFDLDDGTAKIFNVYRCKTEDQHCALIKGSTDELLDMWVTIKMDNN